MTKHPRSWRALKALRLATVVADTLMAGLLVGLFIERSVHQQVDRRHGFVAGHVPLAEVAQKVVGTRLRLCRDEPAAAVGKSFLHLQAWEGAEDALDVVCGQRLDAEATVVESNTHRAHRDLRLLVKRKRRRRVERDQVPDELDTAIRETLALDERTRSIGAIHFEAIGP